MLYFDFYPLDAAKLCVILSASNLKWKEYFFNSLNVKNGIENQNDCGYVDSLEHQYDYDNLLLSLKVLCDKNKNAFIKEETNLKLAEVFTVQMFYGGIESLEIKEYYSRVFEIFTNAKFKIDLDFYVKLSVDMNWIFYDTYLFTKIINSKCLLDQIFLNMNKNDLTCLFANRLNHFYCLVNQMDNFDFSFYKILSLENRIFAKCDIILDSIFYETVKLLNKLFVFFKNENRCLMKTYEIDVADRKIYDDLILDAISLLRNKENSSKLFLDKINKLEDCSFFFVSLLKHLDSYFDCYFNDNVFLKDLLLKNQNFININFIQGLLFLLKHERASFVNEYELYQDCLSQLVQLCYQIMVKNIDYYQSCLPFSTLKMLRSQQESQNWSFKEFEKIKGGDFFWSIVLQESTLNKMSLDLFYIFDIVSMLEQKNTNNQDILDLLLNLSFNVFIPINISDSAFFEQIFQKRLDLYKLRKILLNSSNSSLVNNFTDSKLKIDFQNEKIKNIVIKIILNIFCSPLDACNEILNSLLIFRPMYYNKLVSYLFTHHLTVLSKKYCEEIDVLTEEKMNFMTYMLIYKFTHSYDIISTKSFVDFIQSMCKFNSSIVNFENIFANILAYCDKKSAQYELSVLQVLNDLLMPKTTYKWSGQSFILIISYLLKILNHVWQNQTKKEIICSVISRYIDNCKHIHLDSKQVAFVTVLMKNEKNCPIECLLFYIEQCLDFPINKSIFMNSYLKIHYAAISSNSLWLTEELSQSNIFFDQLFVILAKENVLLHLTQNELQNLTEFLYKLYPKSHIVLLLSLILFNKIHQYSQFKAENLVYMCRSLFILFEQFFNQLCQPQNKHTNGRILNSEFMFIYFILNSIDIRFSLDTNLSYTCNQVGIEVKKLLDACTVILVDQLQEGKIISRIEEQRKYLLNILLYFNEYIDNLSKNFDCNLQECFDETNRTQLRNKIKKLNLNCIKSK